MNSSSVLIKISGSVNKTSTFIYTYTHKIDMYGKICVGMQIRVREETQYTEQLINQNMQDNAIFKLNLSITCLISFRIYFA